MRVRLLLVPAVVVVIVYYSCGGSTHFTNGGPDAQFGANAGDAATTPIDAGSDAGTDAGAADASCLLQNLPTGQVTANDSCGSGGNGQVATIQAVSCFDVTITVVPDSETCHGTLTGPTNAFDGGCANTFGACTSANLPGIIHCTTPGAL